ncbi:MAG: B12-binding domain-containing radical SAM protein, partial [Candidatus Hodarchaeota archaeon]
MKGPSINSLIEIARGCGRRCHFCDPTLRRMRNIPLEQIIAEAEINAAYGKRSTWILSEDIFLYRCDSKNFQPNREALIELYQALMAIEGVDNILATHGSLAPVAADPKMVEELTAIVGKKYNKMLGLQPGIETGSTRLIEKNMPKKTLPFAPDEWHDVVVDAIRILNKNNWFPWCTLILGLPGEEKEDIEETIALVDELSGTYCTITPTFFVPMGSSKNSYRFSMEDLTEIYWELIYKCWKHSSQAENQGCYLHAPQINIVTKLALMLTMKIGSRAVLRRIKRTQQHLMSRTLQI